MWDAAHDETYIKTITSHHPQLQEVLDRRWYIAQQQSVRYTPDGSLLAFGKEDLILWDVQENRPRSVLDLKIGGIRSIAFSPDGKVVASGSSRGKVSLKEVATGNDRLSPLVHEEGVLSLAFSPDGKILATSSGKSFVTPSEVMKIDNENPSAPIPRDFPGIVKFWDLSTGRVKFQHSTTSKVHTVAYSPDGETLAIGQENGEVALLDARTGLVRRTIDVGSRAVKVLAYSPDQKTLVAGCGNRVVFMNP